MIDGYVKNNNDEVLKEKGYFWGRRCRSKVLDKLHHTLSKLTEREREREREGGREGERERARERSASYTHNNHNYADCNFMMMMVVAIVVEMMLKKKLEDIYGFHLARQSRSK